MTNYVIKHPGKSAFVITTALAAILWALVHTAQKQPTVKVCVSPTASPQTTDPVVFVGYAFDGDTWPTGVPATREEDGRLCAHIPYTQGHVLKINGNFTDKNGNWADLTK